MRDNYMREKRKTHRENKKFMQNFGMEASRERRVR
jgi:hypothetical protein